MTWADLRKRTVLGTGWVKDSPVSDADLAELGYVKLDGIDVEALAEAVRSYLHRGPPDPCGCNGFEEGVVAAVLAAIDQEPTP